MKCNSLIPDSEVHVYVRTRTLIYLIHITCTCTFEPYYMYILHVQSRLPERSPALSDSLSYATVLNPAQQYFLYIMTVLRDSLSDVTSDLNFSSPLGHVN